MSESDSTASDHAAPDREVTTDGAQDLLPGAAGDPPVEAAPEAQAAPATEWPPAPGPDLDRDPEPEPEPEPVPAPDPASARETASAPAAPEPFERMAAALERLEDRLEESQRLLARQSEIASSLHAENQRLRAGELRRALLPLARDIMRVHDDLKQIVKAELEAGADPEAMQRDPLSIGVRQIVDALARNGIEETPVAAGDAFDPRLHKAVGVASTDAADAHRTVADVTKSGFVWEDGAPIRPADVRVFKHTPAPVADEPAAPASDVIEAQP